MVALLLYHALRIYIVAVINISSSSSSNGSKMNVIFFSVILRVILQEVHVGTR